MTCRDASENSAARWVFVVDAIDGRRAASHCRVKGRETRQKNEQAAATQMRNFLLDAAEAWVQWGSTRRWIRTRGSADPVCGSRVTCEDG